MKILHIITGLGLGGAEMMLFHLASHFQRSIGPQKVISLTGGGPVGLKLSAEGIEVESLGLRLDPSAPAKLAELAYLVRKARPDVVHTWMYHADLLGGLVTRLTSAAPVVWSIHHSNMDFNCNKRSTLVVAALCARLSGLLPTRIACCSSVAARIHVEKGYLGEKLRVIPNGFDTRLFQPAPEEKLSLRRRLGLPEEAFLIGSVGRFHPQKDYPNFLNAAQMMTGSPEIQFVLAGSELSLDNSVLQRWIKERGLEERFHLLGVRSDISNLLKTFDAFTLSSCGEGVPMAAGEAMASGIPCVVTDVGDAAVLVGDTGLVVPPARPEKLAGAWRRFIQMGEVERRQFGRAARERIREHFSLEKIAEQYCLLYEEVLAQHQSTAKRTG